MRSFEERIAEIDRRSKKIIQARRQRLKWIGVACIPLALCVAASGAWMLPAVMFPDFGNQNAGMNNSGGECVVPEEEGCSVEVSGNGVSGFFTSTEDVQRILGLIDGAAEVPEMSNKDFHYGMTEGDAAAGEQENETETGYFIRVRQGDGTAKAYLLLRSWLIDQDTGKVFFLEEKASLELKEALGIG